MGHGSCDRQTIGHRHPPKRSPQRLANTVPATAQKSKPSIRTMVPYVAPWRSTAQGPQQKGREQEMLLFPAFHRFPVPQTSPARTTAGTASQRKAINVPCPVILPNKSFWKGWGELEGGRETFFQKGSPFPPHSRTSTSPTRSSRNAWSSPHRAGRARGLPERRGNP